MKTADHITTSQNLQHQKAQSPFAKKDGEQLFFSEVQTDIAPFFNPQSQTKNESFFSPRSIQPKLSIGRPGDRYEQEADAVADRVVENLSERTGSNEGAPQPVSVSDQSQTATPNTQAASQSEKEEVPEEKIQEGNEKEIRRKPIFESADDPVQPKLNGAAPLLQKQAEEEENSAEQDQGQLAKETKVETGTDEEAEENTREEGGAAGTDPAGTKGEGVPTDSQTLQEEAIKTAEELSDTRDVSSGTEMKPGEEMQTSDSAGDRATPETEKATTGKDKKAAHKLTSSASTPSESSTKENLADKSGKTTGDKKEGAVSESTSNSAAKAAATDQDSTTPAAGSTAEAPANTTKPVTGQKDKDLGSQDVPIKMETPALPEPGDKILDQKPERPKLGISEGQQRDHILAKGASMDEAPAELSDKLQRSKGKGQSLDDSTAQQMGEQMGADFSGVRIHTDSEASSMNQDIGARAFTHGNDIYFNKSQYDTSSTEGKRLLAHELTHTVQQGAVTSVSPKLEKADQPKPATRTPQVQRGLLGAVGGLAKAAGVVAAKVAIKELGEFAMKKIMENILGVKGDKNKKTGDWKTQLMNMGREFLTGKKSADAKLAQSNAKAEEQTSVKKGTQNVNQAKADPLPPDLMALLQTLLNFGSGGGLSGAFGTDKASEEQAVQAGVQEDPSGWDHINAISGELAPMAGENEEEVKTLVAAIGKLKESNWRSLQAWMGLFEAGKGLIPGLGDMMAKGKQALTTGFKALKGMLGENVTELWQKGSKLANAILGGSEIFQQRALQAAQQQGQQMQSDAHKEGKKVLGKAKGTEREGSNLMKALRLLSDERAMKVFELVSTAIRSAITIIRGLGSSGQAVQGTFDGVREQVNQGKRILRQIIEKIRQFIAKVKAAIMKMIKRAYEFMKRAVKRAIKAAKRLIKRVWAKIKELARRAIAKVKALIKKVTDKIKAYLKKAIEWVKRKIITPIKNMIKRAKERIQNWWKKRKEKKKRKKSTAEDVNKGLEAIDTEERKYLQEGKITEENAKKVARTVKRRYRKAFKKITVIDGKQSWDYKYIQRELKKGEGKYEENKEGIIEEVKKDFAAKLPKEVSNSSEIKSLAKNVFNKYRGKGLKSFKANINPNKPGLFEIEAEASPGQKVAETRLNPTLNLSEIEMRSMSEGGTSIIAQVYRTKIGPFRSESKTVHAEDIMLRDLRNNWDKYVATLVRRTKPSQNLVNVRIKINITRSSCMNCYRKMRRFVSDMRAKKVQGFDGFNVIWNIMPMTLYHGVGGGLRKSSIRALELLRRNGHQLTEPNFMRITEQFGIDPSKLPPDSKNWLKTRLIEIKKEIRRIKDNIDTK